MDKAQFEREKECGAAFAIARQLLRRELITQDEHQKLTVVLIQKYRPSVSSKPDPACNPNPKEKLDGKKIRKEVSVR